MSSLKSALAGTFLAVATAAGAQTLQPETVSPEPVGQPLTFGSLRILPSLSLRDVGLDSNVYNRNQVVREDLTYTVAPRVKAELPIGDAHLEGTGGLGFVFFRTAKDQESVNSAFSGLLDVRSGRVRPSVQAGYSRGRHRRGDVDTRALSVATNGRAGVEVGVSGITSLTAWVARENSAYAAGQLFLGEDLSDQLDRKASTFAAGARFALTPFTSVVAAAELEQVRFTVNRTRDADSWKLTPTVRFSEGAILNGSVHAGLRDFRPIGGAMRPYRGVIAGGDISFSVKGVTRFSLRGVRDLVYSYDELQPYYIDSGGQATLSQRVIGPLDAIAIVGRRRFRYESLTTTERGAPRIETMTLWGGGIGVRVDDNMRFTFTVDREKRLSTASTVRQFDRVRALAALEYMP